jgi:hypothetical protein
VGAPSDLFHLELKLLNARTWSRSFIGPWLVKFASGSPGMPSLWRPSVFWYVCGVTILYRHLFKRSSSNDDETLVCSTAQDSVERLPETVIVKESRADIWAGTVFLLLHHVYCFYSMVWWNFICSRCLHYNDAVQCNIGNAVCCALSCAVGTHSNNNKSCDHCFYIVKCIPGATSRRQWPLHDSSP